MKAGGLALLVLCHRGTAVFEMSTAVYPASGPPSTPAVSPAASPTAPRTPFRSLSTADPAASGAAAERIHEPTFIGEDGRNTRSIFRKRSGLPRSWISSA